MGNDMGNNNVSGLPENGKNKFDAPRKSLEVHITVIGGDSVKVEDQPVSSSKGDFHENLISGNPSVIGDPRAEMEVSAKIDDCWIELTRDGKGNLVPKNSTFPSGIKALVDYVHSKGLKLGIYSDARYFITCSKTMPGSLGHEEQEAKTFAAWV